MARQETQGWGAKVIDRLAVDLRREFPEKKGLSSRNLKYMRAIAEAWQVRQFVQEVLAQITSTTTSPFWTKTCLYQALRSHVICI
jgi:hypothetical protein